MRYPIFILLFLISLETSAQTVLYGFDRGLGGGESAPTTLVELDPTDGSLNSTIGLSGLGQITAIVYDSSTDQLFATHGGGGCCPVATYAGCLLETDISTGVTNIVGCDPIYQGNDNMAALALSPSGDLYGALLACNAGPQDCNIYLVEVDKTTGALTLVGIINDWPEGNGMAFGADGLLYHHDNDTGLGTINLATGAKTPLPSTTYVGLPNQDDPRITDMTLHPVTGVLYASLADLDINDEAVSFLCTVDTNTGVITVVGQIPGFVNSIAFGAAASVIPTMGEWGIICLSLLMMIGGLLAYKRREKYAF